MRLISLFRILLVALSLGLGVAAVHAEDVGAIKARMAQRLSSVDSLKERTLVGENNRGYLEARGSLTPSEEQTVSSENADRRDVYAAIAASTGSTTDDVGRQRARMIASSSKRGVWVQSPDGQWSQKG